MIKIRNILCFVFISLLLFSCTEKTNWTLENGKLVIQNDTGMTEWIGLLNATPEEDWGAILDSVQTIAFKEGVTVIQTAAFEHCHNLKEVTMSDSVHTIEEWAFDGCTSLKTIHWSKGLKIIEEEAFAECSIEEIILPKGVLEIQANAFVDCNRVKRIVLPESVYLITGVMELENLEQLVFLGNRPEKINGTSIERFEFYTTKQLFTVYYLNKNVEMWSPNGETEWYGMPIIGIDSLEDLPAL